MTTARVRSIESLPAADPLTGQEVLIGSQAGRTVGVKPSDITAAVAGAAAALVRGAPFPRSGYANTSSLSLGQRLDFDAVDLREWSGIDFTGNNDSASVFQAACNQTAAAGVDLVSRIPGTITLGSKIVSHSGKPLRLRSTVRPQISRFFPSEFNTAQLRGNACWLRFAHSDTGIEFNRGPNDVRLPTGPERVFGNSFVGFGTCRDQGDVTSSSWAPLDTGFDISVRNSGAEIDIVTLNSSRVLELFNADKSTVNIKGQPLIEVVRALYNYDTIAINDIELWPYWSFHRNVKYYTSLTRVALRTARADGIYVKRIFDFQGFITHKVESAPQITISGQTFPGGTSYYSHVHYLYADSTSTAIQVDQGASAAKLTYDKVIYGPPDSGGLEEDTRFAGRQTNGVLVLAPYMTLAIGNYAGAYAGASHVLIASTGAGSHVGIGHADYGSWNRADLVSAPTAFPAFAVDPTASFAKIEIGIKHEMNTQVGSGANIEDMRRPMPVFSGAVSTGARADADGNATAPQFRASVKLTDGWSLDGSAGVVSLAAGATISVAAGSGALVLTDGSTGATALVVLGAGGLAVGPQSVANRFVASSTPSSSQIGIYFDSVYKIKSGLAAAVTLTAASIKAL